MISFNSIGHMFATAFKAVAQYAPKIEKDIEGVEKTQGTVDVVTSTLDPSVTPLVDAGYAVLGEVASVLNAGGDAASSKLADAGLDVNVINLVKALIGKIEGVAAVAKTVK